MKLIFAIMVTLFFATSGLAQEIDDVLAVRAIMGEARDQGYTGMLAVACAIRNRGTLDGVYGVRAKGLDKEPARVWLLAKKAWQESKSVDITNGATHWHNLKREGETYWTKKLPKVYEHKDHVFYQERRMLCRKF